MPESRILLGVIGRPHGVRGLVHVTSHTADPADLTAYGPVSDVSGRRTFLLKWRAPGVAEVAELVDGAAAKLADRVAAERLTNTRLFIDRAALPEPAAEEFYLADLIGLAAVDGNGARIGTVSAVHDYGAGTSLEIAAEDAAPLLVPFTRAAVPDVNVAGGRVTVEMPALVSLSGYADPCEAPSVNGDDETTGTGTMEIQRSVPDTAPSPGSLCSAPSPASERGGR